MKKIEFETFSHYLKPRLRDSHKGNFGHVLIVGGEAGFSGAVELAGEAALRVGAGLVSVATRREHASLINLTRPELMCHGVDTPSELHNLLNKSTCVAVGPGISSENWAQELIKFIFANPKSKVVDADALNFLAKHPEQNSNWILTPHPGEAARLLNVTTAEIQKDRISAIKKIQLKFGGTCVLKGAGTLVFSGGEDIFICDAGNPGMASAGMGDVLSGVIAGLLAQEVPLEEAAKLGVIVHAMAGDLAAKKGQRGMIASDLMKYLRKVVNI